MPEIPFAFVIDGQTLDPSTAQDPQDAELLEQVVNAISARAEGLLCPEHQEPPRFLCRGPSLEELEVEVHGCCEQLIELTSQRMTPQ